MANDDDVLVRVENLVKYFPVKAGGFIRHTVGHVHAVDDVSLIIERGKTLGLVGETGSGKSTLARCVAGLIPVTSGKVIFDGHGHHQPVAAARCARCAARSR